MQVLSTPHGNVEISAKHFILTSEGRRISNQKPPSSKLNRPYLKRTNGSPLTLAIMTSTDAFGYGLICDRATDLLGLEVGGPVQFVNWAELRSLLMIERPTFLKLLKQKGRLNLSPSRLRSIEVENKPLTAKELIAFSTVYNIDLNALKPKEA